MGPPWCSGQGKSATLSAQWRRSTRIRQWRGKFHGILPSSFGREGRSADGGIWLRASHTKVEVMSELSCRTAHSRRRLLRCLILSVLAGSAALASCADLPVQTAALPVQTAAPPVHTAPVPVPSEPEPTSQRPTYYTYRVVQAFPHDRGAFTQGLAFDGGFLYEGTGLNGQSSLRRVDLQTGEVLQIERLSAEFFGEGIAIFADRIVQLTLSSGMGFVYDRQSFSRLGQFSYSGKGWGITHDGTRLIMSDGTARLRLLETETFQEIGGLAVSDGGQPVLWLNELEYVRGEIYANVWQTDRIVRISPQTGQVLGWIDLTGLLSADDQASGAGVLNGIAFDVERNRLFVTGKNWPWVFEIQVVPAPDP